MLALDHTRMHIAHSAAKKRSSEQGSGQRWDRLGGVEWRATLTRTLMGRRGTRRGTSIIMTQIRNEVSTRKSMPSILALSVLLPLAPRTAMTVIMVTNSSVLTLNGGWRWGQGLQRGIGTPQSWPRG